MKKRLLFVDGNWYLNRAWYVVNTNNDIGRALAYMMVSMICRDAIRVKATHLLVGFDGMSFRYRVYKLYKSARKEKMKAHGTNKEGKKKSKSDETTKEIYTYLPAVQKYLVECGIPFEHPTKFEADDVGAACAALASDDFMVFIGTADKDSAQLLSKNVVMYNSTIKAPKNPYTQRKDIKRRYGVRPSQMVDYQTLIGDKGDSVPSLKPFSPAKAQKLLTKYGSISKWVKEGPKGGKRWFNQNREDVLRNRKLVMLNSACTELHKDELIVPRLTKNTKNFPSAWHDYQALLYPKTKGLFS